MNLVRILFESCPCPRQVRQWSDSIELGLPMGVVKLHRDAIAAQVKEMLGVITAAAGRDGRGYVVPSPASTTSASSMTASSVGSGKGGRLHRAPLSRGAPQPPTSSSASSSASASGVPCSPRAAKAQLWALLRAAAHPRTGDEQLLMILSLCMVGAAWTALSFLCCAGWCSVGGSLCLCLVP